MTFAQIISTLCVASSAWIGNAASNDGRGLFITDETAKMLTLQQEGIAERVKFNSESLAGVFWRLSPSGRHLCKPKEGPAVS